MMSYQEFEVTTSEANNRTKTLIQHKLRLILKCYTVFNFKLDSVNQTFTCNKCYKVRRLIRREDPRLIEGKYEIEEIDSNKSIIKIWAE